jgi:SAM-dependent methyltransferase
MGEGHRLHRKLWEYGYIAQALFERGMLAPGRRGLGFAVGKEPLPALFARFGCQIVATDLETTRARRGGWTSTNQHASQLDDLNERGICPPTDFRSRVSFRFVDMNRIPDDLTGFDFVWSSCAFEHLGTLNRGIRFIERMTRCLRPGGVAVHTTEFNLSSKWRTLRWGQDVIYRECDLEKMKLCLSREGHDMEPLQLVSGNDPADQIVDKPPYCDAPHLKLQLRRFVTTSLGLIVHVGSKKQEAPHHWLHRLLPWSKQSA